MPLVGFKHSVKSKAKMSAALTTPALVRFWNSTDKSGGSDACWECCLGKDKDGYAHIVIEGKRTIAHRYSWQLHNGYIPAGMWVLHSCDNPPCVNPKHLFLGTCQDNIDDKMTKGRHKGPRGESNRGSKLSKTQVIRVRLLRRIFGYTYPKLSKMFGIHKNTAQRICTGKLWSHLG